MTAPTDEFTAVLARRRVLEDKDAIADGRRFARRVFAPDASRHGLPQWW